MWGGFDLGKTLGDALGEALEKATKDVERSIDGTLGIGDKSKFQAIQL